MLYRWLVLIISLISLAAWGEEPNFGQLILARDFKKENAILKGYTGGSYSLSSIANTDYRNLPCLGYGDHKPDHIIILENDFANLKITVDSKGNDTTLLIKGEGKIRCGDDTGAPLRGSLQDGPDASIDDHNWTAGRYEIWVGSIEPNQRWNYRLSVQE